MQKRLTIITVNYNNVAGLRTTVASVLSQTWQDYEWLVVDGGSSDGSRELIESCAQHLIWWCSESDDGIYAAMNKGIAHATGRRLLFLNSGDALYADDTLQRVMQHDSEADVLYGDALRVNGKEEDGVWHYSDRLTLGELLYFPINHQATYIRASLLKECGYDTSYKIVADHKRNVEMFVAGCTFEHLPFIASRYDMSGLSTLNQQRVTDEINRFLGAMYGEQVAEIMHDWHTFQNKPCMQTRQYCSESRVWRRMIRSTLHVITWLRRLRGRR